MHIDFKTLWDGLNKAGEEMYQKPNLCPTLTHKNMYEVNSDWKKQCTNLDENRFKKEAICCWKRHWLEGFLPTCAICIKEK